jgi:hypothetical protein
MAPAQLPLLHYFFFFEKPLGQYFGMEFGAMFSTFDTGRCALPFQFCCP